MDGRTYERTDVPTDGHFRPPLILLVKNLLGRLEAALNELIWYSYLSFVSKKCGFIVQSHLAFIPAEIYAGRSGLAHDTMPAAMPVVN